MLASPPALAAKPKKKDPPAAVAPAPPPVAPPSVVKPAEKSPVKPVDKPAEKPADKPVEKPVEKPTEKPVDKPADPEPAAKPIVRPSAFPDEDSGIKTPKRRKDSVWSGFFFDFGFGYATTGGMAGPDIPNVQGTLNFNGIQVKQTILLHTVGDYSALVTNDVGGGMAAMLQFGYNVAGYVSFWLDIGAHGTISSDKKNMAGGGGASVLAGFHPLRFVRPDLPVDIKLYGGFTPLEVLAYNENQAQVDYKAKAWLGAAHPFGLQTEWKPNIDNAFALGVDLRFVHAMYDQWYWNWDRTEYSALSPTVNTVRFEPRITMAAHF